MMEQDEISTLIAMYVETEVHPTKFIEQEITQRIKLKFHIIKVMDLGEIAI